MVWTEVLSKTGAQQSPDEDRRKVLEAEKEVSLPAINKEVEKKSTMVSQAVKYQPVQSPGIYEAEFALHKGKVIFHFWPHGYHQAERDNKNPPNFFRQFESALRETVKEIYPGLQVAFHDDRDMGAWCVEVPGMEGRQFWREQAIKACEKLHKALGGEDG